MKKFLFAMLAAMLVLVAFSTASLAESCQHDGETSVTREESTCTASGVATTYCVKCGDAIGSEVIEATGHDMEMGDVVAATCDAAGVENFYCANGCGYTKKNDLPKLNHKMEATDDMVAAGCKTDGYTVMKCVNAGCAHTETIVIKATGHNNVFVRVYEDDTCTGIGLEQWQCTVCFAYETVEVNDIKDHNWETIKVVEPTCTKAGQKTEVCSICGEEKITSLPATGHKWSAWSVELEPTCEVNGLRTRRCLSDCCYDAYNNETVTEHEIIPAHGHEVDPKYGVLGDGTLTGTCIHCSKKVTVTDINDADMDQDTDGTPTVVPGNNSGATNNGSSNNGSSNSGSSNRPATNNSGVTIPATSDNTSVAPIVMIMVAFVGLTVLAATKQKVHG